jgi:uncharacterized protein YyaL (SSP411 family)
MERFPSMVGHHLAALHSLISARELAIVGPDWPELARVYWKRFRPNVTLAPSADGAGPIPLLQGRSLPGETRAYLCRDHVCDLPASEAATLAAQLDPVP